MFQIDVSWNYEKNIFFNFQILRCAHSSPSLQGISWKIVSTLELSGMLLPLLSKSLDSIHLTHVLLQVVADQSSYIWATGGLTK